jgi:hypothetical protein
MKVDTFTLLTFATLTLGFLLNVAINTRAQTNVRAGDVTRFTNKNGVTTGVRVTAGALSCDISVTQRPTMAPRAAMYSQVTGICEKGTTLIGTYTDVLQPGVSVSKTLTSGSDSLTIQFDIGTPLLAWKATANGKSDNGTL